MAAWGFVYFAMMNTAIAGLRRLRCLVSDDGLRRVVAATRSPGGPHGSLLTHRWREMDSSLYGAFPVK